jgi:hypothetical protein
MSPTDDQRWAALGRQVERTDTRVGELEELIASLAADVTTLVARRKAGEGEVPVSWLALGGGSTEAARAVLRDLVAWLGDVYLRYSDATLPSCWLWHPDVVEELLWLHGCHRAAYDPEQGSWQRVADWHDRLRPGVVKRLTDPSTAHCELSRHAPDGDRANPARAVPLATSADLDHLAKAWTTDPDTPAEPTPEQLNRSATHNSARHH